ncbi:MAG: hypothetical protein U0791_11505 [Gemmataceae bacterium]
MPDNHYWQFVLFGFLGIGLVFSAVLNLASRQARFGCRLAATSLAGGATVLACWVHERNVSLLGPLAALLTVGLLFALLLTTPLPRLLLQGLQHPINVWRACSILGVAIIVAAAARYEENDAASVDRDMAEVEALANSNWQFDPARFIIERELTTDSGDPVETWTPIHPRSVDERVRIENKFFRDLWSREEVLRTAAADDRSNCFGWIFTGGRHLISPASTEQILLRNGYREVASPAPGDLIAYREKGVLIHIAIVRYAAEKRPPLVEGKWGINGVFVHPADKSIYGREFAYLRSPRVGHLLNGLRVEEPPPDERTE